MMPQNDISVIIPTLNEVENITYIIRHLKSIMPQAEIIISDGGSRDGTLQKAFHMAKTLTADMGRARQMNAGAELATGNIFWFLHADCRPSEKSGDLILKSLSNNFDLDNHISSGV